MKKVIGNEVWVFLRSSIGTIGDIFGLLVDVDDESLYVQNFDANNPTVFIVPRDNVKYCTTTSLPSTSLTLDAVEKQFRQEPIEHLQTKQEELKPQALNIYINKEHIASIPVPPTFNLETWNENIMRIIMGNPDIRIILANKIQKSVEYWPGEVYIELTDEDTSTELQQNNEQQDQNSFSMSNGPGGDITTKFVNPSQMISRLNSVASRGRKNGENKV